MIDRQLYKNVSDYWNRVTDDDLAAGVAAYPAYLEMMKRISTHYQTGLVQTTEAFVPLSPNNDYFGNLRSLVSLIVGYKSGESYVISTYKACGKRAMSYLDGSVSFTDTVKGKKIRAFRHNILYQKNSCEFVLDGHMIAVALGRSMTMTEANLELRGYGYDKLTAPYRRLARRVEMPVHELQATLWHCRKRTEGIKFSTQKDMWRDDHHLIYDVSEILPY